jgi:HlyD family secretion protein
MKRISGPVGVIAVWALGLQACTTGEAEELPTFQTVEVSRGDLSIRAEATGVVEPVRKVEVKSKASGEILRLHIDIGDDVEPGALLAEIDPRDVRNRFDQVEADLAVAQARVEISRAQLDRSNQLLQAQVITQQEHEGTRLEYANAQANLVKAQTNFELAELQLADVLIRAPMAGTIIQKNVEEGAVIQSASQNVSGGTVLFLMANLAEMQVRTLVDETDMGDLRPDMAAVVSVEAFPDRSFRGVVQKIEPQATVEQNVTMFPVIVTLDNRSELLKPGMNAEVEILIDEAVDVLLVPNNAIVGTADVGPAALALGMTLDDLDIDRFMRAGRGTRMLRPDGESGEAGGDGAVAEGSGGDDDGADNGGRRSDDGTDGRPAAGPGAREGIGELRAEAGAMRSRGAGGFAGLEGITGGEPERVTRPAVVFVMGTDSVPEPRLVEIGLGDWDNTEVASGVHEGDVLIVVGPAQLQAQQQEFLNRMRSRQSGNPFGGGGGPGRGGR